MKKLWVLLALVFCVGCSNPSTPAGYAGYLTRGAWLGSEQFYGVQLGPTSPGMSWLLTVKNISVTPYTYTEAFTGDSAVLAKDNLKLEFQAHSVFRIRKDETSIKMFMEQFSYVLDSEEEKKTDVVLAAYANFIKEPFRTYLRDEVQQRNGLEVKDQLIPIGEAVQHRLRVYAKDSPFQIDSVVVGNIQYPKTVADAVALKLQTTQDLQRQDTEIAITQKEAEKRKIEAQGIANAMDLIQAKLTNQYLQHEAIEAQKLMVNSPNHTIIYVPSGPLGVPVTEAGRAVK